VAWACIILVGTSLPGAAVPAPAGSDKALHFAAYFILGALCCPLVVVAQRKALAAVVVLVCVFLFAALDEAHQLLIPGRFAGPDDWIADSAGAFAGLTLAYLITKWRKVDS
jgi:VanZ family protein